MSPPLDVIQQSERRPRSAEASISVKKVTPGRPSKELITLAPSTYLPPQPVHLVTQRSVRARFRCQVETLWGDQVILVGSSAQLGRWQPHDTSIELTTDKASYPTWSVTTDLVCEDEEVLEYKVVVVRASRSHAVPSQPPLFEWEPLTENRKLAPHAHHAGKAAHINLDFGEPGCSVSWRWEW